ncbi:transmembrane protein 68-like [Thamnophis elegans]|uniref:transmembrane protein 68-like n=1 Tax=Thamnophis elegans TaxID=35005 RepID=UPI001376E495|nr:transmembrane protein 68-like [Thamnophis elegans]
MSDTDPVIVPALAPSSVFAFRPEAESWDASLERFEVFLQAHDLSELPEGRRRGTFLHYCGPEMFATARALSAPTPVHTMPLDLLMARLKLHYEPTPSKYSHRQFFRRCIQRQSISQYVAELRAAAINCEFSDLEDALLEQFIYGLLDINLHRQILSRTELSMKIAVDEAWTYKMASQSTLDVRRFPPSALPALPNSAVHSQMMVLDPCADATASVDCLRSMPPWDGGYELHGIENIPDGPGLIIYYHGAVPMDYLCFLAKIFILKRKCCYSIADDCVFIFPGVQALAGVTGIIQNKKEECLNVLKKGKLLGISPGGMREALFSDKSYKLIWHKRKGFAQLAVDMKVPIIPMCTQNVREGYWIFGRSRALARRLYEYSRIPFLPVYGGFPVKFRTYIGEPILYNPNVTSEELAEKTQIALQSLIRKHQQIPGSICRALLERFHKEKKKE